MTYFDFKQLLNDAAFNNHMKVNLVDTSIRKPVWTSIGHYVDYLDNLEQFNDEYVDRITYLPEFDVRNRVRMIRIEIKHPSHNDVPEKMDWMIWEVVYK